MRKSKKLLLAAIAALALPATAAAQDQPPVTAPDDCQIVIETAAETDAALQAYGLNFAGYHTLCPLLRDAGLGVAADGAAGLVEDRRYALTEVRLFDLDTRTRGWFEVTSTSMSPDTPEDNPDRLPVDAINTALQAIAEQPDAVIASVGEEDARLLIVAATPAPPPPAPGPDCSVTFRTSDAFVELVNSWTDISLATDALCQRLAAANAGIVLTEATGVLTDRPYGWVKIGLFDLVTLLDSPMRSTTMSLLPAIEPGASEQVLRSALLAGVDVLERDQDAFFASLAGEVAAMRAALGPGSAN